MFFFLKANKQAKNSTVLSFDQVLILCFIFYVEVTQSSAKHKTIASALTVRGSTREIARKAREIVYRWATQCALRDQITCSMLFMMYLFRWMASMAESSPDPDKCVKDTTCKLNRYDQEESAKRDAYGTTNR